MLTLTCDTVHEILDKTIPPAAYCDSGDRVVFETRDCYNNVVRDEQFPLGQGEPELENPVTGPLYIRGAEVGDVLKVEIGAITLRSWGVMRSSVEAGVFAGTYPAKAARIFALEGDTFAFGDDLKLKLAPMIGVIGTAPAGEGIAATTPGSHGGNMDCKRITSGTTLYLPVNAPGALLFMGDLHGLMGDGEVFICGLETAGQVEVTVTVLKDCALPTPFLRAENEIMTIQSAPTLDQAARLSAQSLLAFLQDVGYNALDAGMLLSLCANLAVCQMVDPLFTVRAEFPLAVLEQKGFQLH